MGTSSTALADNVFPAREGQIAVFNVPAQPAAAMVIDLTMLPNIPAGVTGADARAYWHGCYVTLQADGDDIYWALADDVAGSLDPTSIGPGIVPRVPARIVGGTQTDELFPGMSKLGVDPTSDDRYRYLKVICRAGKASQLRMWVSSTRLQ